MADYFTNFSLVLNLASEAEQADAFDPADKACLAQQGDELPAEFPKTLVDVIEDWSFETVAETSGTKRGIWLHSMYGVWMRRAHSSNTCSRNSIRRAE